MTDAARIAEEVLMDSREIEEVGNAIVRTDFRDDQNCSDNLAIVLVSDYEGERDCPDEPNDDESGWKPWALAKEKDLRRRMAISAIQALDKLRGSEVQRLTTALEKAEREKERLRGILATLSAKWANEDWITDQDAMAATVNAALSEGVG